MSADKTEPLEFDENLVCDRAVRDPYGYFADIRESDPIHWNPKHKAWIITRFDDVTATLKSPHLTASRIEPFRQAVSKAENSPEVDETFRILADWMVFLDPPDHTRIRRLVSRVFAPPVVRARTEAMTEVVGALIAELPVGTPIDIMEEFAAPLPAIVIAQMLGVPPADRRLFKEWSDLITGLVFGAYDDPDRFKSAAHGMMELKNYLLDLISKFEKNPEDNLISLLLQHEDGDSLSRDELISTCTLLLFGGHETTTNLISSGLLALLRFPDQMADLRANRDIFPMAVEEMIRFDGPARATVRLVKEDHEFRGVTFRAGERVFIANPAANHDPRVFTNPGQLDLRRNPNNHLGFGFGVHFCLGAPLARLEVELAIGALLDSFSRIELACDYDQLAWHPTMLSRGLTKLPVTLHR